MDKLSPLQRRLLSAEEVAHILGISVRTIYNRSGKRSINPLPFRVRRLGKRLRIDMEDLKKYIESI